MIFLKRFKKFISLGHRGFFIFPGGNKPLKYGVWDFGMTVLLPKT